ncbi:MAG: nitroreductase family protein [Pirellulaceae bacterium]|nr:nitroreductase family protein [Pirellulaceae bacterium]
MATIIGATSGGARIPHITTILTANDSHLHRFRGLHVDTQFLAFEIMTINLDEFELLARTRKTTKVLAEAGFEALQFEQQIQQLLQCAGQAPFHKACAMQHRTAALDGIEPWRFHILPAVQCRHLAAQMRDVEAAGKIPAMLLSAHALLVATWLPNPTCGINDSTSDNESFEATVENVEHIAAAAAAVQSLLLAATAAGLDNYWSSGGVLRLSTWRRAIGVADSERVLGAIFLFPSQLPVHPAAQVVGSKQRERRSPPTAWSRWVSFADGDQTS